MWLLLWPMSINQPIGMQHEWHHHHLSKQYEQAFSKRSSLCEDIAELKTLQSSSQKFFLFVHVVCVGGQRQIISVDAATHKHMLYAKKYLLLPQALFAKLASLWNILCYTSVLQQAHSLQRGAEHHYSEWWRTQQQHGMTEEIEAWCRTEAEAVGHSQTVP